MATIGKIGEFNEEKEFFECYVERLEQYFEANKNEKRRAILITVCGPQTYGLLKNLIAPALPKEMEYEQLVTVLKEHYAPKSLIIAERFKFHKRNQAENESVASFVVELKRLATKCDFGDFLLQALRDRLVCGLRSDAVQRKLLSEANLTLEKATEISLAMELAEKNTREFKPSSGSTAESSASIDKLSEGNKRFTARKNMGAASNATISVSCGRCGAKHPSSECRFRKEKCHACGKQGHIARMCRSKQSSSTQVQPTKYLEGDNSEELGLFTVYTAREGSAYKVDVRVDGKMVKMEVDTGAAVSVLPEDLYWDKLQHLPLKETRTRLKTYSGEQVPLLGILEVPVEYQGQKENLPLVVVKGARPALLGRSWLEKLKLNWPNIFSVVQEEGVAELLQKHQTIFQDGYGTLKGFKAQIKLREGATPVFCKARTVPYALKETVEKELERLEASRIISKVEHSEWATPIVVVPKPDNTVRLCGDYKVTVNQNVEVPQYPLSNAEEIFATLAGGKYFTKLDLSHAYQQLELHPDSQKLLTINTHKGLYQYRRLAFRVSSAPAIFQATLEQILQGLDHVKCRLDDILISTETVASHVELLEEVLNRLEQHGLRLNRNKCVFLQPRVEYLGHAVDQEGIHPLPGKVKAIQEAPTPTNVTELKSFLGLLNYYGKFLADLSTTVQPLHQLLQKNSPWKWTEQCQAAFEGCKRQLLGSQPLVHFDMKKPLKLATDASSYGVGAVLSHVMEDGQERPIAFASRTLTASEKNYSQLEKEALGIIFGVKKFHQYLYGHKFTLEVDHQPLTTILVPRMLYQHWLLHGYKDGHLY